MPESTIQAKLRRFPLTFYVYLAVLLIGALLALPDGPTRYFGIFIIGVTLLLQGGQWLIDGAVSLSRRMNWPPLLIGLTVVAFGTSAPELALNISAAWHGNTGLSFGNIVGSNIANIGLVLGVAGLVFPITVHRRIVTQELPLLIGVSLLFGGLAFLPPRIVFEGVETLGWSRLAGLVLLAAFALFLWSWYRLAKRSPDDAPGIEFIEAATEEVARVQTIPAAITLLIAGIALLWAGGNLAESGAVDIAAWVGLSDVIIGLTIVALATSLPEVVASLIAALRKESDLAVGNVIGSNLFNILLVMGVTSLIRPVPLPDDYVWHDLSVMTLFTVVLMVFMMIGRMALSRIECLILLAGYFGYGAFMLMR